jgi:hypothetical protein
VWGPYWPTGPPAPRVFAVALPTSLVSTGSKSLTYSLHGVGPLLDKLTGSHLVNKFLAFYGTRTFITTFTSACHLPLSWTLFHFLGCNKGSVYLRVVFECIVTRYIFTVRSCQHLAQPLSWRITPCRMSATAYAIYSQLLSILTWICLTRGWYALHRSHRSL